MREFCKEATGADIGQADVPGLAAALWCGDSLSHRNPTNEGGDKAMAKKTAKSGAKKKGGKKR